MQWFGKAIGAVLGLAVAGPWGSLLGVVLGHQFDEGVGRQFGGAADTQGLFFAVTFEVMGHLAKVDGRVTEEEIRIARRIMHAMHLNPEQVKSAIGFFTTGKSPGYPMGERVRELASRIGGRRDLARAFVEIQLQAALGGGPIDAGKRRLLWQIARSLGMSRAELAQIEALLRAQQGGPANETGPTLGDAYKVLGVDSSASDSAVKTAYRRLMSQHHPDKLVARGLPASMTAIAEEKTREIRAAWERIRSERNIR